MRLLLARWPQHPRVELVTTDGFLHPNAELERRGLMARKGFPESYDRRALLRFVTEVKAGRAEVTAPVYSHLTYDIVPEARARPCTGPDILLLEGLNVLQPAQPPARAGGAGGERLHRLLGLRRRGHRRHPALVRRAVPAAARDRVPQPELVLPPLRRAGRGRRRSRAPRASGPRSTGRTWSSNIMPTRGRASLVLRKGPEHNVTGIRLRKV